MKYLKTLENWGISKEKTKEIKKWMNDNNLDSIDSPDGDGHDNLEYYDWGDLGSKKI